MVLVGVVLTYAYALTHELPRESWLAISVLLGAAHVTGGLIGFAIGRARIEHVEDLP